MHAGLLWHTSYRAKHRWPTALLNHPPTTEPHLLLPLVPRELHSVGIDNHHDIAAVIVWAKRWLVLPADDGSDLGREPAYNLLSIASIRTKGAEGRCYQKNTL